MHRVWPEGPGFSLLDSSVSWPGHLLGGLVVGLWLAMAQPSAQSFVRFFVVLLLLCPIHTCSLKSCYSKSPNANRTQNLNLTK